MQNMSEILKNLRHQDKIIFKTDNIEISVHVKKKRKLQKPDAAARITKPLLASTPQQPTP
jgi:hypothetical protein